MTLKLGTFYGPYSGFSNKTDALYLRFQSEVTNRCSSELYPVRYPENRGDRKYKQKLPNNKTFITSSCDEGQRTCLKRKRKTDKNELVHKAVVL